MEKINKALLLATPARLAEKIYKRDRNLDVDYDSLNYEIHICTYNEEGFIEETLESLARQDPVKNGDVDIVLIDSHSEDDTVEIAKPYVDEVFFSGEGLLTARNMGIEGRNADVVLSADAGDVYTEGWIDELSKPFSDDDVVATFGTIYSKEQKFKRGQQIKHTIVNTWNLPGNNSAIRVSALEETGMFDESIDQQELIDMLLEEQVFKKVELASIGKIELRPYAAMYKSQRRKMLSSESTDKYDEEREEGERF